VKQYGLNQGEGRADRSSKIRASDVSLATIQQGPVVPRMKNGNGCWLGGAPTGIGKGGENRLYRQFCFGENFIHPDFVRIIKGKKRGKCEQEKDRKKETTVPEMNRRQRTVGGARIFLKQGEPSLFCQQGGHVAQRLKKLDFKKSNKGEGTATLQPRRGGRGFLLLRRVTICFPLETIAA